MTPRKNATPSLAERAGRSLPGAVIANGALAAIVAASFWMAAGAAANPTFVLVRANHGSYPDSLSGPLHVLGISLGPGGFAALLLILSACYLIVLALAGTLGPRIAIGAIIAAHVAFALGPPLLSSDVFNYIGYARLDVVHGLNPYEHALDAAPTDASFPYIGWPHSTSAYGPVFTLLTLPLAKLGLAAALWTLKALTALASLACVALVWGCARRLGKDPVPAAVFFGLNPVLLVFTVGGAHNDLLMMAAALGGVFLVLGHRREGEGVAAMVGAAAVKVSAGLLVPFGILGSLRRLRALVFAVLVTAGLAALSLVVFGSELLNAVRVLGDESHTTSLHSVPRSISTITGISLDTLRPLGTVISLAVIAVLLWRVWRRQTPWVDAAGWATFAVLVTTTYMLPWYAVWLLPFAALATTPNQRLAAIGVCAFTIALRIPTIV